MQIPLLGGAYTSRFVGANAQRCVNLYPEPNPKDSPTPTTHYQRPGLRPFWTPTLAGPGRGLFRLSNGNCVAVVGHGVYAISPLGAGTQLGTLQIAASTPVSIVDNGIQALIVDSSPLGYEIDLATNAFRQHLDSDGGFLGGVRTDYIDSFVVWNTPETNQFKSSLSFSLLSDPLYVAAKVGWPDPIQSMIINRHQMLLVGQLKSEIWYNAGLAQFPFAQLPGAYFEHGAVAPFSIASADISTFWLSQDLEGAGLVVRARGYECKKISNFALEYAIRKMMFSVGVADAIGTTYLMDGHLFYMLSFPAGNQTWVFDDASGDWHQQCWTSPQGSLDRSRVAFCAFVNQKNLGMDWENGTVYQLDPEYYYDQVLGVPGPISRIRSFPHTMAGTSSTSTGANAGASVSSDGKRIQYNSFMANLECGNGPLGADGQPAKVTLRWSDDRGKTFSSDQLQSAGAPGEWITRPLWRGLGIAWDRVYEIEYSFAGEAALQGAWSEQTVLLS